MVFFYLMPHWFFGYGVLLQLMFGIVTFLVAHYSLKVYKLSGQRELKYLSFSFASISLSYIVLLVVEAIAWTQIKASSSVLTIGAYTAYALIAGYAHILFMLIGFSTLAYVTFGLAHHRLYSFIVTLSILVVIFSSKVSLAFNFVAAFLLLYVLLHYLSKLFMQKNNKVILTLTSITFLFVARVVFAFTEFNPILYAVSHFIEFLGYAIMVVSLVKLLR